MISIDLHRYTHIHIFIYIHTHTQKDIFWNSSRKCSLFFLNCLRNIKFYNSQWSFQIQIVLGFVRSKGLFVIMQVSHITLFPYRLFQAHFTSRRDDGQIIFHVILNKMTHAIKYTVFGSHLMKKAKERI